MSYSIFIGIFGYVWSNILTDDGMILNWFDKWSAKYMPDYLYKPIIGCAYCVSGQLALWSYFFMFEYNFLDHILFITTSIFTVEVITFLKRICS